MTLQEALLAARRRLEAANLRTPCQDAELLLASVVHKNRAFLIAHPEYTLSSSQQARFKEWLRLRVDHYPLQYLRGEQEFYGRPFLVTPEVLIPRAETELLVEQALRLVDGQTNPRILDIGTGSGCLAVSLCCEHPCLRVCATDCSRAALGVAQKNALRHGCLPRITFWEGDLVAPARKRGQRFGVAVCNPPYAAADEPESVDRSVRWYEPRRAVFGGPSGLEVITRLLRQAPDVLLAGGHLVLELGMGQATPVLDLATSMGWCFAELQADLAGVDRRLTLTWPT
jgi:release factor glutamine methyltransferase